MSACSALTPRAAGLTAPGPCSSRWVPQHLGNAALCQAGRRLAENLASQQRPRSRLQATAIGDGLTEAQRQQQHQQSGTGSGFGAAAASRDSSVLQQAAAELEPDSLVRDPEDFLLLPGELSRVDRSLPQSAVDVFRCAACTLPECQTAAGCASMQWRNTQWGYLREVLTAKVYDVALETPLELAEKLSEASGNRILLKREDLQPVKSFKLRGAYNKMAQLSREQLDAGVICSSAGNHAQGVALAARTLGCTAVICMPTTTPDIKVRAVMALGGDVDLAGESYQEAQAHAQSRAAAEGRVFIAPYDDPYTIAGQGTIGNEILRQTDMDALDAIFVAVGGGGLVAGIAAYVKALKPSIKVFGVEPTGANAMAQSLALGQRVTLSKVDAFADGVAVKYVGAETFRLCRELVDGVVLVDNAATSAAIKDVFNETRSILEPAGAVSVAGAKAYLQHHGLQGQTVVAVTSGANMNFDRLRLVAELADVGGQREAMLAVTIPERPGTFVDFVETAIDGTDIPITEFKYRYKEDTDAHVLFSVGVAPSSMACREVMQRLVDRGYQTIDISDIEMAQVHLRHLVGGRARGSNGHLANERIMQVDFPERPGALRDFLAGLDTRWNITLFHYRRTGNNASGVLLGIQVPPEDDEEFNASAAALSSDFSFNELSGKAREVFKMFIS